MDYAVHSSEEKESIPSVLTGLAYYLVRDGILDLTTAKTSIDEAQKNDISLIKYLINSHILPNEVLLEYCAKNFGLPIFDLKKYDMSWMHDLTLSPELILRYRVLPLNRDQHNLYLGITDPTNYEGINAVSFHSSLRIRPMLVSELELDRIITTFYRPHLFHSQLEATLAKITPLIESNIPENEEENDEPVIEFVDQLIHEAIEKNVSDIHIEPYLDHCRIRFRRDGLLYEAASLPNHLSARVISRLKIMANLNIAERRLPQDGRIRLAKLAKIDIRINTCPILYNEKIVLRILNSHSPITMDALGLTVTQKELFLQKLSLPQGLILVTGPTGSGKTVTLYSALGYLNTIEKNISTVEDPVEVELPGINQVNINPKIGLDFSAVMRTFLRQDPDIIMLGEIRDLETANIAMQAAQTGHLVLSTLHTNSALETLSRLRAMGVTIDHLTHALSLIIAQRLVRKLCTLCKQQESFSIDGEEPFFSYRAMGCQQCYQGYQGRIAIFEFIPINKEIIFSLENTEIIKNLTTRKKFGWQSLWEAGLEKVKEGETSYAEIVRVLG